MMRKRSAVVSARLTADELALITQAARAAGVSVSAYLRNAAALAALRSCPGATSRELPGGGYVVTWTNVPGCTITA
jgi:hypothetical protein